MTLVIKNNKTESRFEAEVSGCVAFVDYTMGDGKLTLVHTEVPPELSGQGLGGKIVKAVLEFAVNQRLKVVVQCPFARSYIERHHEYAGIVSQ